MIFFLAVSLNCERMSSMALIVSWSRISSSELSAWTKFLFSSRRSLSFLTSLKLRNGVRFLQMAAWDRIFSAIKKGQITFLGIFHDTPFFRDTIWSSCVFLVKFRRFKYPHDLIAIYLQTHIRIISWNYETSSCFMKWQCYSISRNSCPIRTP